jgi:hypothetical protein
MCFERGLLKREGHLGGGMRKVLRTIFLDKEQLARLNRLSAITRVPKAAYIREGIDIVLKKYEKGLKGRAKKRE